MALYSRSKHKTKIPLGVVFKRELKLLALLHLCIIVRVLLVFFFKWFSVFFKVFFCIRLYVLGDFQTFNLWKFLDFHTFKNVRFSNFYFWKFLDFQTFTFENFQILKLLEILRFSYFLNLSSRLQFENFQTSSYILADL